MNDRLEGSCYHNPIWQGKWRIYLSSIGGRCYEFEYEFIHDDYDGAEDAMDNRFGYAKSIEDAKEQIKELESS